MFDETSNDQALRIFRTWKILGKIDMISKYISRQIMYVLHILNKYKN
jgi:hypothetical protein